MTADQWAWLAVAVIIITALGIWFIISTRTSTTTRKVRK